MNVAELLRAATGELRAAGVDAPRTDAELLLCRVLGATRSELHTDSRRVVGAGERGELRALLARRARREPLAYVLGEWGFRRLVLRTDSRALVPRPETETVVERCLSLLADAAEPDVLDVGTGTGAIALALADEHPGARVTALDSSAAALALAGENLERTGLESRVRLVEGDIADGLPAGPFHLVVSNPPYVAADELPSLEPEVREWEPREALVDAGQTDRLAAAAQAVLRPAGALVLECHERRTRAIASALSSAGYEGVTITKDLAGRERVVDGRWRR
jgi:release factor glutamine methyltransferase